MIGALLTEFPELGKSAASVEGAIIWQCLTGLQQSVEGRGLGLGMGRVVERTTSRFRVRSSVKRLMSAVELTLISETS